MQKDEQIEFWISQIKEILNDSSRTNPEKKSELDDLEEQIKDRLEDPNLNFNDDYVENVMIHIIADYECLSINNAYIYTEPSYMVDSNPSEPALVLSPL